MHPMLRKLEGGDRRSLGRAPEVVAEVIDDPDLLSGLLSEDAVVRMRAADAMEKASVRSPECLEPHKGFLIGQAAKSNQKEVRWQVPAPVPAMHQMTHAILEISHAPRQTAQLRRPHRMDR
ncbi:MAG: hypothetical protein IPK39_22600 [Sulfuritalea sp.]|nr:hypothetical protein [Sulfuritalea sp.]